MPNPRLIAALACACLLAAPPSPARAQIGFGVGVGGAPFGERFENIRIGAVARGKLEEYLQAEFKRQCTDNKNEKEKAALCAEQRPHYKSSFLPVRGNDLPPALLHDLGFTYPGTDYRQIGFSIYLIRLPDRRIHDVVSIWSDGWK
jgi:hypothetical protein